MVNKSIVLDDQGNYNESIQAIDKAIQLKPDYAEAWNNKGKALRNQGKNSEAKVAFAKAKELWNSE